MDTYGILWQCEKGTPCQEDVQAVLQQIIEILAGPHEQAGQKLARSHKRLIPVKHGLASNELGQGLQAKQVNSPRFRSCLAQQIPRRTSLENNQTLIKNILGSTRCVKLNLRAKLLVVSDVSETCLAVPLFLSETCFAET